MEIKGATVVITGAAGGLGKAMSFAFADAGAVVVISDLREDSLAAAVNEVEARGGKAIAVTADTSKEADAERLMKEAVSRTGRLDVAVLNAGILRDGLLVRVDKETGKVKGKLSLDQWQAVIDVNLTGVFLTGREAAVQMI
ncbi:MAG TPA: SDR family NAD(P)-dependent oxidoreductase, partial [Leptospiraceae bacterium]|nr:SDR family NAD(P)-dependent oxidoreductase [Leptospiraceae bacterium]